MDYRDIDFGNTDAQTEASTNPELLKSGFVDVTRMVNSALNTPKYLFLGYKGSGKSALSEHLQLLSENETNIKVHHVQMNSFSYNLFNKIIKGEAEQEAKYPIAWNWILLLYALWSFDQDSTCYRHKPEEWSNAINTLHSIGIYPIDDVSDLVKRSSRKTFSVNFNFFEYKNEKEANNIADIPSACEYIKSLLKTFSTQNRHYLTIDGLDDTLTNRDVQHHSVVALINQSKELNNWFIANNIPFKIIVLCRTDIFDSLADPNKNKIKQDFSHSINWFDESETDDYASSGLITLANKRCNLTFPGVEDMFKTFFPQIFDKRPIQNALLEYTRHTPRDFLQLLKKIQESCKTSCVSGRDIEKGIKKYSLEYFKDEIHDEMVGYLDRRHIELVFQLLSQLRTHKFDFKDVELEVARNDDFKSLDLHRIFTVLFNCSAIGLLKGPEKKFYVKYRNPSMTFSSHDQIVLHKGLFKAFVS